MTTEPDAKLIEQGRKLFAGDFKFIWASPSIETLPPMAGMEIAFAGRSNVGKSSLINALTGRNALARTSNTPGRTQELIFFDGPAQAGLRLVDMPGYGYASAPKAKVASWTALIHKYLAGPQQSCARLCADRFPARPQGGRSRRAQDARPVGGELSGGSDQGRSDQAGRAGTARRRRKGCACNTSRPLFRKCSRRPRKRLREFRNCARRWCACLENAGMSNLACFASSSSSPASWAPTA